MSANSVLPPLDVTLRACSSEYLAGTTLNELSECHSRLPMEKRRRRSSRAKGLLSLSRLDTSAKVVGRRYSCGARNPVPIASSSSPRLREKASCSASSTNWSWNTSTAYWSMPSWIAAISGDVSGLPMSMPETSAAKQRPTWRKLMGMDRALPRLAHGRAAVFPRRHRPGARLLREKCEAPAAKRPALCDQGKARKKPRAWGVTGGQRPAADQVRGQREACCGLGITLCMLSRER